ncbi:MAG: tetratricopeptide repeat protein [SAR324 cluster bacterium]|nr:tetratricopeptide repeat protein [SAR324 cluster bacterium]MBL7035262.1 tetratricopeptide repeat protein [SAR324 cluster bacterium]
MKKQLILKLLIVVLFGLVSGCQGIFSPTPSAEETRLRDAILIHPLHEQGYVRLAQLLESQQRHADTFSVLRKGQQQIPDSIALIRLEGRLFQGLGYYSKAQEFYSAQIANNPAEALLLLDRAQLYWRLKKQQLALVDTRKALELNQNLFEAHYLLGVILSQQLISNEADYLEQALDAFIAASRINDQNPDLWLRISTLWESRGELHQAQLAMLRAVELEPEVKLYLRRYAVLLEKELDEANQSDTIAAAKSLQKTLQHTLKLFPEDSWTQAHYGNWAWTQEKYLLAEKHLQKSLELHPSYAWANFRLGIVYYSQKKWKPALQSFEAGLINEPNNEWAVLETAHVLEKLEKNEDAISRYEWLMENSPANLHVVQRLNSLYWDEFLFDKGEETLLRGLERFPAETVLVEKLVAYYESHRLYGKAAKIMKLFVELKPENIAGLSKLGFYEKNLNRPERALFWLNKILKKSPDFEWAHIQQIGILLKTERTAEAESALQKFLKLKPNSEWTLLKLSQLRLNQERYEEAEKMLEKSLIQFPDALGLLQTQGRLYELQLRWKEAENIFRKLIKLRPNNSLLLTHLAFTQWKQQKSKKAGLNIKLALYENPGSLWAWNIHLLLLPKLEQRRWFGDELPVILPVLKALASQRTIEAWRQIKAVRTDPFTLQVLKNTHYLLEEVPQEIKMEPQDLTSKELPPWMHEQWGYFHEMLGNKKLAARHFEAVLKALPDNSWIHARLGWVYERLANLEKSKLHYSLFLQQHPQAFDVSFRLANVETLLGHETETIEIYENIIAQRPNHDLVLNNLAWLYLTAQDRQVRKLERGLELALESVELNPTIDNLDTLAEAYFQSGDRKKAIETLRKAAREVDYSTNRHSYIRKQLLRFRNGEQDSSPPALS